MAPTIQTTDSTMRDAPRNQSRGFIVFYLRNGPVRTSGHSIPTRSFRNPTMYFQTR